jgi:Sec-independent protein translocase protein TatA
MQDSGAFVNGFAIQIPTWLVLIVLAGVLFGAWKLAKAIWAALS